MQPSRDLRLRCLSCVGFYDHSTLDKRVVAKQLTTGLAIQL